MGFEGRLERGDGEFGKVCFGPHAGDVVEVMGVGRASDGVAGGFGMPFSFVGRATQLHRIEGVLGDCAAGTVSGSGIEPRAAITEKLGRSMWAAM